MGNCEYDGTVRELYRWIGIGRKFVTTILDQLFDMLVKILGRNVSEKCLDDLSRNSLGEVVEEEVKLN